MGAILLAGGAEFQGEMAKVDLKAIEITGKGDASVCIIPTAAAPDNNHLRAGENGVRWFKSLGVKDVSSLPVIDRKSANNKHLVYRLTRANIIYLLGGFPGYLEKTLRASHCWTVILEAHQRGALIAGSSAGAMVLCEWFFNPLKKSIQPGLGFLSGVIFIPHFETLGKKWVKIFQKEAREVTLIGIDEQTGIIRENENTPWAVYGKGDVTIYQGNTVRKYSEDTPLFNLKSSG